MKLPKLIRTNFRFSKKILIILIVLLGIAGGIFYYTTRSTGPVIQTAQVKKEDIKTTVSSSGTLTPKESANLKFKTGGKLAYLNVKQGDKVFAGQVLAGLDSADLAINLQQAQNSYRARQADVDKTLDDVYLFQYGNGGFSNVGTQNETMTQRQLRTDAEVLRDNAFDNLKQAQRTFQDTIIISPIDGLVIQADFLPNQFVSPADLIATVVNDNQIFFDAEVDEADIGKIKIGQKAEVSLNSYEDRIFKGTVAEIEPATRETSSGATVVIVRISLEKSDMKFVAGINGQAEIIYDETANALTIPQEALIDEKEVIIKKGENQFEKVPVETGLSSDTEIEIKSGLKEEQEVVTNPDAVKI